MTDKAIEAAARAFVTFNADHEWILSQVQGFRYGQDHVVRDCNLPADRQEVWRKPVSDTSPDDMRDFIDCYRAQQAMAAAIRAYLSAKAEEGFVMVPVEATSRMVEQGYYHAFARHMPNESVQDSYNIARVQWSAMIAAAPKEDTL